ncbi:MAG: dihydroneopterin aldolase [Alphaproteobacteria bacterium]|nr:dihydroneopterin aldolase [Alphaproteobacteria bacterium]
MPDSNKNMTFITVREFILPARIGIYEEERLAHQNISVSVIMTLQDYKIPHDRIEYTVSYEGTVDEIRRLANIHHELVEKFAEDLSNFCLKDPRVYNVEVSIEKLDVYPEGRVGTQIIRTK